VDEIKVENKSVFMKRKGEKTGTEIEI